MKVFITGASGWIGSAVTDELLQHGHHVNGLARSDASAGKLSAVGAQVLRGDLDDLDAIREGAVAADAVIHLANKHDFANPAISNQAERAATQTIAEALVGSDRPFLLVSGLAVPLGRPLTEEDPSPHVGPQAMRGGSEALALDYVERGVRSVAVRFAPTVHGVGDHGFIAVITGAARTRGASLYVGDGENRWPAVHRLDAAHLVRLALESAPAGTVVHAVAEEGVPTKEIAAAIATGLDVPAVSVSQQEAVDAMGFVGAVFAMDLPAASDLTRQRFGWQPTHPTLLEDLASGSYF